MMKFILTHVLLTCSFFSIAQDIVEGKAVNVYDGDTFTLVLDDGTKYKIRVVGIDAPEAKQEYGITARDYARALINNKRVRVYLQPKETYGRKLGIVITPDGKHFSYEMVASGNAWWYSHFTKDEYLEAAEKKAKEKKLGLWSGSSPKAPWDWRKEN